MFYSIMDSMQNSSSTFDTENVEKHTGWNTPGTKDQDNTFRAKMHFHVICMTPT